MVDLGGLAEVSVESYLVCLLHTKLELVGGSLEPVGSSGDQSCGSHQGPVDVIEGQRLELHIDRLGLGLPCGGGGHRDVGGHVPVAVQQLGRGCSLGLLAAVGQQVVHHHLHWAGVVWRHFTGVGWGNLLLSASVLLSQLERSSEMSQENQSNAMQVTILVNGTILVMAWYWYHGW